MLSLLQAIEEDGFAIVPDALIPETVAKLIEAVESLENNSLRRRGGARNLLQTVPEVAALAQSQAIRSLVGPILGDGFFPVRAILFDKTPAANWKVAWHQDLAIPVKERREVEGFTGWSEKEGVAHVLPPARVLEKMLTVRVHLDHCLADNGPLRVIPGSHRRGKLSEMEIADFRANGREVICAGGAGSALLMRPLLLHASSSATSPAHRRVMHIEFAADPLPAGLEWATSKDERDRLYAETHALPVSGGGGPEGRGVGS